MWGVHRMKQKLQSLYVVKALKYGPKGECKMRCVDMLRNKRVLEKTWTKENY